MKREFTQFDESGRIVDPLKNNIITNYKVEVMETVKKPLNKVRVDVMDGVYNATWSACTMTIKRPGVPEVDFETEICVKGINVKQKVQVQNGNVYAV